MTTAATTGAATLLTHADVALYTAKRLGKARATAYDPLMRLPEARDLRMREPLRAAIARREVQAHHQQGYRFGRPVPGGELDLSGLLPDRIVA